jgi:hypothetical protein
VALGWKLDFDLAEHGSTGFETPSAKSIIGFIPGGVIERDLKLSPSLNE